MRDVDPASEARTDVFAARIRDDVDACLRAFFAECVARHHAAAPPTVALVDGIAALTLRGGKRLRPAIAAAAALTIRPTVDWASIVSLGASIESFHASLLAHDDVMDEDLVRRGGPSLNAWFRSRVGDDRLGDSLAILAGNLASVHSLELFHRVPFHESVRATATSEMLRIREHVGLGQYLDLVGDPDLARTRTLKTGSYTVLGPARLGARLACADDDAMATIEAWARPLGEAFQLVDDRIGSLGSCAETGKPADDLRQGRLTSVSMEARERLRGDELAAFERVFGDVNVSEATHRALVGILEEAGVVATVDARIASCHRESELALHRGRESLDPAGVAHLLSLGRRIVRRVR